MIKRFPIKAVFLSAAAAAVACSSPASAQEALTVKDMSLGLAQAIAQGAIEQCRKDGFRVTATVMNRAGQIITVLRDDGTSPHTLDTSRRKAYTSVALRASTTEIAQRIASNPGAAALKDITDVIILGGGLPISVGNEVIGSVGVGGSPAAEKDEVCAKAGLDKVADHLK
jgi:uncharacterized protein GlcG (DUF336 family)